MRRSIKDKADSRRRITSAAARLIREGGVAAMGVAEVMKAADMTHGGFYRHFPSKDALVAAAVRQAADDMLSRLDDLSGEELRSAVRSYLSDYLSLGHVAHPEIGCPIAATAGEGARAGEDIRAVYAATVQRMHAALSRGLDGAVADPAGEAWRIVFRDRGRRDAGADADRCSRDRGRASGCGTRRANSLTPRRLMSVEVAFETENRS